MFFDKFWEERKQKEEEKKKREQIKEKIEKRQAFRAAEKNRDSLNRQVEHLKANRDASWQEARTYMKQGQKHAAQRTLENYRYNEILITRTQKRLQLAEMYLNQMHFADSDQQFMKIYSQLNTIVKLDPAKFEEMMEKYLEGSDVLESNEEALNMGLDEGLAEFRKGEESVPSLEELTASLEDEVADELQSTLHQENTQETEEDQEIRKKIKEGLHRINKLLEEDQ